MAEFESKKQISAVPEQKKDPFKAVPDVIEDRRKDINGNIITNKYYRGNILGKGGFAQVYLSTIMPSKDKYALKIVAKSSLIKTRAKQKLQTEIKIHRSLNHSNIVHFKSYFEDVNFAYMVLELCSNNSMSDLLNNRKRITEIETRYYLQQLVVSLQYLHKNLVIHRDLKLGNLFIDANMKLKVGDFGLATRLEHEHEKKMTVCGTPNYIAPELLEGKKGHSFEVDIWSTGVIMYTLLVGKPPFQSKDVKSTYKRILANAYAFPDHLSFSSESKHLISCMLQTSPENRIKLSDILNHSFFASSNSLTPASLPESALKEIPTTFVYETKIFKTKSLESKPLTYGDENDPNAINRMAPIATSTRSKLVNVSKPIEINKPQLIEEPKHSVASSAPRNKFDIFVDRNPKSIPTNDIVGQLQQELQQINLVPPSQTDNKSISQEQPSLKRLKQSWLPNTVQKSPLEKVTINPEAMLICTPPEQILNSNAIANQRLGTLEQMHEMLNHSFSIVESKKNFIEQENYPISALNLPKNPIAKVWVTRYVDYTSKYGLGFLFNTGSAGVYFNDSTKIVLSPDGQVFQYIERKRKETSFGNDHSCQRYHIESYPTELQKKVTLLKHFKNYLCDQEKNKESNIGGEEGISETVAFKTAFSKEPNDLLPSSKCTSDPIWMEEDYEMPFLKKWIKTKHAILFRMSNRTVQVVFYDRSEVLLSSEARIITYVNKSGERSEHSLDDVMLAGRVDIAKRLKYTKDIMHRLINTQTK